MLGLRLPAVPPAGRTLRPRSFSVLVFLMGEFAHLPVRFDTLHYVVPIRVIRDDKQVQ
jgi:hypothetical protein